jgi:hypothetical protein
MNFNRYATALIIWTMVSAATGSATEIYSGEPLGEALFDLTRAAVLVSHELASASGLRRTDVFRLKDGRLIAMTSRANKVGETFSIEALRVTPSANTPLTKKLPTVSAVQLSK